MHLASPQSAILSAVIFNAIIIILLIPLALRGVQYRPIGAGPLLARSLLIYGVGGVVAPFIGIKLIDLVLEAVGLVISLGEVIFGGVGAGLYAMLIYVLCRFLLRG